MPDYCLAGISITSNLELPLPVLAEPVRGAEVLLLEGPPLDPDEIPTEVSWEWSSAVEATVAYPELGRAWISNGRRILLRPCGEGTEWRGLILPCFAALMHQRGGLSLHASAVCHGNAAIAFLGPCGAGKSTIVAQLTTTGFRFLSDDLLFLTAGTTKESSIHAHPGFSMIKLWEDSAQVAGSRFSRMGRLYPNATKEGFFPRHDFSETRPRPLQCLFVLEEGSQVAIEPIPRRDALGELFRHGYGATVFEGKPPEAHFRQCAELAAKVPLKRLIRPKNFDKTVEVREAIIASLRREPVATPA